MHSLLYHPKFHFDIQRADEEIVLIIRSHPITQVPWFINAIGLVLITFLLNFFVVEFFTVEQQVFMNFFGLTLALVYAWTNFLRWYFHVGIVTNQRIVDIDFPSTLYKEVTIAELRDVQEVTTRAIGYIGAVFNFGHIMVQTAGTKANIEFHNAPRPSEVVKVINELTQQQHASR